MKTTKTTLQASQITCQGCANTVKTVVRKVAGVEDVTVDVAAQTVTVEHAPEVKRDALVNALDKAGFPAT